MLTLPAWLHSQAEGDTQRISHSRTSLLTANGILRAHQVSDIEGYTVHCVMQLARCKVGVDLGCSDATMSQQLLGLVERHTILYEPADDGMAETVEVQSFTEGSWQDCG